MSFLELTHKFKRGDSAIRSKLADNFSDIQSNYNSSLSDNNFETGIRLPYFWQLFNSYGGYPIYNYDAFNMVSVSKYATGKYQFQSGLTVINSTYQPVILFNSNLPFNIIYDIGQNTTTSQWWVKGYTIDSSGLLVDAANVVLGIVTNYWGTDTTIDSSGGNISYPAADDFSLILDNATADPVHIDNNLGLVEQACLKVGNDNLDSTVKNTRAIPRAEMVINACCQLKWNSTANEWELNTAGVMHNALDVLTTNSGATAIVSFELPAGVTGHLAFVQAIDPSGRVCGVAAPVVTAGNDSVVKVTVNVYDLTGASAIGCERINIMVICSKNDNGF